MKRALIIAVMVTFAIVFAFSGQAPAGEKVFVASATWDVFGPLYEATLLITNVWVSGNDKDLIIQFNAETAVYFSDYDNITNFLSDNDYLQAVIQVWVEVDGEPVPITPGGWEAGVVFYQVYESQWNWVGTYGAETTTLQNQYEQRRHANSFQWFVVDPGTGLHTIKVKASVSKYTSGLEGFLDAIVGARTMTVEVAELQ